MYSLCEHNMSTTRRDFLKLAAVGAGALVLGFAGGYQ
ncbi:MAG: twin-arginine translocation signal domain-containing protein [Thermofilum sp.]